MAWNSESGLEDWMMEELAGLGYATASGAEISPEKRDPERRSFHDAILRKVLTKAVQLLNPDLPDGAVQEVMERLTVEVFAGDLIAENRRLHGLITRGVPITCLSQGEERNDRARVANNPAPSPTSGLTSRSRLTASSG